MTSKIIKVLGGACAAAVIALAPAPAALAGSEFDFGAVVESFEYRERQGDFMKETGLQAGVYAGYTHLFDLGIVGNVFLSYAGGDLDYDGGLQVQYPDGRSEDIPGTSQTPNTIFNFRISGGYRVDLAGLELVPFAGFGYRLLSNELGDTIDLEGYGPTYVSCSGYTRDQSYLYAPLGLRGGIALGGWSVEAVAEYDLFLAGRNRSHRAECGDDTTFNQETGMGYRASLLLVSPPIAGSWRLTVEPYYEHWEVDDSEIVEELVNVGGRLETMYSLEPENDTTAIGVRIGARY